MKSKLKVAVAGTGYFSQFHFDAWSRCSEVEIVGIASLDREAASALAADHDTASFGDVAEMLRQTDADLLDIITPPSTHIDLIGIAAQQGVDVICQKPFCDDLGIAQKAIDVAEAAGTTIVVHENFRFQPWYSAIRDQLEQGILGEVYQVRFDFRPGDGQGPDAYLQRQPYFQKMPRFLVHETLIHYVDVFRFLFGSVSAVWASLRRLNPQILGEDAGLLILDFDNGQRGLIDGNRLSDHTAENRRLTMGEMCIEGEKGTLFLDGAGDIRLRDHGSNEWRSVDYHWNDKGFGGDCVYRFTRHVVDHYWVGNALQNTAQDYLANMKIEEAVYRSSSEGCWVPMAEA